jgi:hypothetical protein
MTESIPTTDNLRTRPPAIPWRRVWGLLRPIWRGVTAMVGLSVAELGHAEDDEASSRFRCGCTYPPGTLVALYLLAQRTFFGFDGAVDLSLGMQSVRGAVSRCFDLIDTPETAEAETLVKAA